METIQIASWNEFRQFVNNNAVVKDGVVVKDTGLGVPAYWRGQRNTEWPLAAAFERTYLVYNTEGFPFPKYLTPVYPYTDRLNQFLKVGLRPFRDQYLKDFQEAVSGLRGINPKELSTEQWWALGRHYGLITPLLDWTKKPYIAAFFAITELYRDMHRPGQGIMWNDDAVAIYRLAHTEDLDGSELKIVNVLVDELGRMQHQRGLFTWLDSDKYLELQGFLDDTGRGELLTKIILSDQALRGAMKDFENFGIDHRLLFPDLSGAAMYANMRRDALMMASMPD